MFPNSRGHEVRSQRRECCATFPQSLSVCRLFPHTKTSSPGRFLLISLGYHIFPPPKPLIVNHTDTNIANLSNSWTKRTPRRKQISLTRPNQVLYPFLQNTRCQIAKPQPEAKTQPNPKNKNANARNRLKNTSPNLLQPED